LFWERKALEEREEFALIKSLIYARKKNRLRAQGCQIQLKISVDICNLCNIQNGAIARAIQKKS